MKSPRGLFIYYLRQIIWKSFFLLPTDTHTFIFFFFSKKVKLNFWLNCFRYNGFYAFWVSRKTFFLSVVFRSLFHLIATLLEFPVSFFLRFDVLSLLQKTMIKIVKIVDSILTYILLFGDPSLELPILKHQSFKRQPDKLVKQTQTIPRQQPKNGLSVFDHFVGIALKGLNATTNMS